MFCKNCAAEISNQAKICPKCGEPTGFIENSPKSKITAALLCFFLGCFGAHRFYVGKVGTGIIQLFTLGVFGIWTIIDLIYLICDKFTDSQDRPLK